MVEPERQIDTILKPSGASFVWTLLKESVFSQGFNAVKLIHEQEGSKLAPHNGFIYWPAQSTVPTSKSAVQAEGMGRLIKKRNLASPRKLNMFLVRLAHCFTASFSTAKKLCQYSHSIWSSMPNDGIERRPQTARQGERGAHAPAILYRSNIIIERINQPSESGLSFLKYGL
jgi:hypothetical protein